MHHKNIFYQCKIQQATINVCKTTIEVKGTHCRKSPAIQIILKTVNQIIKHFQVGLSKLTR